jgi:NAD(P)-dependent dehydrogenase (short-subunit alcohol dehydrogenase family)
MGILEGKVVLITGTGGGQGRAAAQVFTREGALVIGGDIDTTANAETARLIRNAGGQMTGVAPVDLTDEDQVRDFVERAAAAYGGLDVVYNNAAIAYFGPMPDFPFERWRATISGELDIPFLVTKFAWPHLSSDAEAASSSTWLPKPGRSRGRFRPWWRTPPRTPGSWG